MAPANLKVLVVEDQSLLALELKTLLRRWGYEVLGPVPTIDRALELLDRTEPDLAVLDVNVNGRSIEPVATALAAENTPFVLVSGYARKELPDNVLSHAPLLNKPVNRDRLKRTLEQVAHALQGDVGSLDV